MYDAFIYGSLCACNFVTKKRQAFNIEYNAASEEVKKGVYTN